MAYKEDFLNKLGYIDGITIIDKYGKILFSVKFNPDLNPTAQTGDIIGKSLFSVFKNIDIDTSTLFKAMKEDRVINKSRQEVKNIFDDTIQTINMSLPIKSNNQVIGAIELSRNINNKRQSGGIELDSTMFKNIELLNEHANPNRARYSLDSIITKNNEMLRLKEFAKKVARGKAPVMIHGETGTGKELFAHAIHNEGLNREAPFISQNCAAIPENLLEGLLFGTAKGSFTGADDKPGLFELAQDGTIFLDEINSMPMLLQSKLLRVIEDGYVRRLGDRREIKLNTRIITATNIDPIVCVKKGIMRRDIYYRLSVIDIKIPPLRNRREDIEILLKYFINKYNNLLSKNISRVSKEAYRLLYDYQWFGNVRELEHVIEYAINIMEDYEDSIKVEHIEDRINYDFYTDREVELEPLDNAVSNLEIKLIKEALNKTAGNVSAAARLLKVPRQTLQRKRQKYNIII